MTLIGTLASLGMAFGAPFIYADQAWSIQKRRNAEGFSKDVCAVLIIANICRIFFWFGERFELALLLQSVLLIAAQLFLLHLLLKFRAGSFASSAYSVASGDQGGAGTQHRQRQQTRPPADARQTTVTDFSADDEGAEQGMNGAGQNKNDTSASNAAFGALFGGTKAAKYAPLMGSVHLPMAPTLDEDDDDNANGGHQQRRGFLAQAKSIIHGGLRRREGTTRRDGSSGGRPFGFWTWPKYDSYIVFLVLLVLFLGVLQLLLGWSRTYIGFLGFFALGLEATLPIPQAVKNWQRKSLSGLRLTVLIGWTGGDLFKSIYFVVSGSPIQFLICGLFTLVIDFIICAQLYMYRDQTARDDEEQRIAEAEALEAGQREQAPIGDDGVFPVRAGTASQPSKTARAAPRGSSSARGHTEPDESSRFQIEADDEDDDDDADLGKQRR